MVIDQGIKLIIKFNFFHSFIEIIPNFLFFDPIINIHGSWLNARFNLNGNFTILKSYIDDFEYVDYLYEHYILEASNQMRKQEYKHILEEVIRIERKYGKEYNGRSIQDVGIVGEKQAI